MDPQRRRRWRQAPLPPPQQRPNPQDAQEPPEKIELGEMAIDFIIQNIRGPSLAVLFTQLVAHPLLGWAMIPHRQQATSHVLLVQIAAQHVNFAVRWILFALFAVLPRSVTSSTTNSVPLSQLAVTTAVNHALLHFVLRPRSSSASASIHSPLPGFPRLYCGFALASLSHELLSSALSRRHPSSLLLNAVLPLATGAVLYHVHAVAFLVWLAWRVDARLERRIRLLFQGTVFHKLGLTNANAWAFQDFHRSQNLPTLGSEFADHVLFGQVHPRWLGVGRAQGYLKLQQQLRQQQQTPY